MIGKLIDFILRERFLVVSLASMLVVGGLYAFKYLNIEAYPDPSPPTIEVITQNPGWSAEEMERQITVPLETQLNGMPGLDHIRSISLFGLSDVKCYFRYDTDYNFDRQEVLNRLQMVSLPPGAQPTLSPSSAIGEIYRYRLAGDGYSLMDLKVIQDWILERQFKQVPGVIDVVSFGGTTKEFHVELDPNKLIAFNVSVPQVLTAIANSNSNVGANYLELGSESYDVRGIGLFRNTEDIADVVVTARNGTPISIKQLGTVNMGGKVPLGRVGKDKESDIVQGIVLMRRGEKSLPTLERVRQKVYHFNHGILPNGVQIIPYYDRTDLINLTTHTVIHTLISGMVLVALILLVFLGDFRASLVVALSVPLSLLFTFIVMVLRGDSANLISMGAIDFGIGDDLEKLEQTATQIAGAMKTVRGIADLGIFGELGQPNLLIRADRQLAGRYGVFPGDVNGTVQAAIGGQAVTQLLDGDRRFDVVVRFLPQYRRNAEAIGNIPVGTPDGGRIPLKQVAEILKQTGASFIYREDNARYIPVKFSVRGRDLESTIAEGEERIKQQVRVPEGYRYEWAGEFQELQEAIARLKIAVPASLLIIFVLLYTHFRTVRDALMVLGAVPLALIGGMVSLLVTGTNFSISAAVGFISLFGVAVLDGVILISYINELRQQGFALDEAVFRGSELRLRPVLMTALAAAIGLFPASIATGIGSQTQRPLARVVVGGMVTAPILILLVLPALYSLVHHYVKSPSMPAGVTESDPATED